MQQVMLPPEQEFCLAETSMAVAAAKIGRERRVAAAKRILNEDCKLNESKFDLKRKLVFTGFLYVDLKVRVYRKIDVYPLLNPSLADPLFRIFSDCRLTSVV